MRLSKQNLFIIATLILISFSTSSCALNESIEPTGMIDNAIENKDTLANDTLAKENKDTLIKGGYIDIEINTMDIFRDEDENFDVIREIYKEDIDWHTSMDAAHQIRFMRIDLNRDDKDEIIAYFESAAYTGSAGNIQLDIWEEYNGSYKNIGFEDTIYFNFRTNTLESVMLRVSEETRNNYCVLSVLYNFTAYTKRTQYFFNGDQYVQLKNRS